MTIIPAKGADPRIQFVDLEAQRRRLSNGLLAAMTAVIERGNFIFGAEVAELEQKLAAHCGMAHAVTCANGTDALMLALRAHGVEPGDAVIVPSFTFAATASAVAHIGAVPIFIDVLRDSFNIDSSQIGKGAALARSLGLSPRFVIAVDLFGCPAQYDEICAESDRQGLMVLVDAAQSFGATYRGRSSMSFGAIGATSFFPSKPLGCYGDGGAVFTNDAPTAQLLRSLRCHGQGAHKYENVRLGWNSRLDTLQAAVLLQKLSIFADEMRARERIARLYAALLGEGVTAPTIPADMVSSWAQYTITLSNRDRTAADLQQAGIPTAVYYPVPLHKQPAFANYPRLDDLSRSEWLSAHVLSLPMHPYLTEETQRYIADSVLQAEYA